MIFPKPKSTTIDFTRQDLVEEMLSKQALNGDDEHCMRLADLNDLRLLPGNRMCVDCAKSNPDWASISLGVFMCLECSGQHRSLGTHVSKVRSVRMDSWSPEQLRLMKVGGNEQCLAFLSKHRRGGDEMTGGDHCRKLTTIVERYDCAAAMWYQEILKARRDDLPEPIHMPEYTPTRRTFISMDSLGSTSRPHSPMQRMSSGSHVNLKETSKHVENVIKSSQQVVVDKAKGLFQNLSKHISSKRREHPEKPPGIGCVSSTTDDGSSDDGTSSFSE